MSDCPKCWDTPCSCGHEGYWVIYKSEVPEGVTKAQIIEAIKKMLKEK